MITLPLNKNLDAPLKFKAGTVLFSEGEISKYLFIIKSGKVRLIESHGARLSVSRICKQKELINDLSIVSNKPTSFSAIAFTDVELVLIEQADILEVIKKCPFWLPRVFKTLCDRLIATQDIINEHNLMVGEKTDDMVLTKTEEKKYSSALLSYKD